MFFVLASFAGAFHVLAPDHWIPASLFSWQRRLGTKRTLLLALPIYTIHCGLGAALYFAVRGAVPAFGLRRLALFSWALILALAVVRAVRFSRVREVFYSGPNGLWGLFTVLSLLGPAESLIPVLLKAHLSGLGYCGALLAYWIGSVVAGTGFILGGKYVWDRPILLTRGIQLGRRMISGFSVAAGVAAGLTLLLHLR